MRVLVTGAYGLIGSAVLARLHCDGHAVTGAGRSIAQAKRRFAYAPWVEADFTRLVTADAWLPLLAGIDAVVNCVGVLQEGAGDDITRVQVDGTVALFDACAKAGVRRVVHVSAVGAAADAPTPFARTKAQADAHLMSLDLDWIILRPTLVLAPAAYGGTAMLRGLAGVPLLTPIAGADSAMQVVSVGDLTATVGLCLRDGAPAKAVWELAHPQVHSLGDIVAALRQWHGFRPQPQLRIPGKIAPVIAMFAEITGLLGWRSPARWTALAQLNAGAVGDPSAWMSATAIAPRSLDAILAEWPASVQDRWFARLYWLKPFAIFMLAAFWVVTGLIALGPGHAQAVTQLTQAGVSAEAAGWTVEVGAMFDIVLGFAICVRRLTRIGLVAMLVVSAAYLVAGTILTPQLWHDPLGPLVKIVPIAIAMLLTLAIVDDR